MSNSWIPRLINVPAAAGGEQPGAREASTRLGQWVLESKLLRWRAPVGRGLLYLLVALLPLHAGLVAYGVPSLWKELVVAMTLVIALTLPARASLGRLDFLLVGYFALVIASAAVHHVTSLADLAPYFVYVPLAIIVPRLLVTSRHVAILVGVGVASLLLNVGWMLAIRLGTINAPNLLLLAGPHWNTTGSLTGAGLATATLYGVIAGLAWVAGGVSSHRVRNWLLALLFTGAGALTGSRAAIEVAGFGGLVTIALIAAHMRSGSVIRPLLACLFICLSIGVAYVVAAQYTARVSPAAAGPSASGHPAATVPFFGRADDSLRVKRWETTLQTALKNPFLGAGPGATSQSRAIRELGLVGSDAISLPDNVVGTRISESSVLKVAAEVGFPALVAFAIWLVSVIVRAGAVSPARWYGGDYEFIGPATVILTIVNGLTTPNIESFVGAILFWMGVGLCRSKLSLPKDVLQSALREPQGGFATGGSAQIS